MPDAFTFPDAMLAVVTALRTALAASDDTAADGATVGTRTPVGDGPPVASLPYVLVRLDGGRISDRVVETSTIRVAVWHRSEALSLALAQLCRALLISGGAGTSVRTVRPLTGPFLTADSESGLPLSFFTLSVSTRPSATL